jgi:hypothetical protein
MERLDLIQRENGSMIAPIEEVDGGSRIGLPCMSIPNLRREELEEDSSGVIAGTGEESRQSVTAHGDLHSVVVEKAGEQ